MRERRWILAPFYLGLIAGPVLLLIHFARQLVELVLKILGTGESDVILGVLKRWPGEPDRAAETDG